MSDRPHHPPRNQLGDGWLSRERALVLVLLAATAMAVYACYRLAQPFLPALAWALALAVVTSPLHAWLLRRLHKPSLAAAVAVALVAVAVVGPTLLVTQQLVRQAASGINWLQSEASAESWGAALDRYPRLGPGLAWLAERIDLRGAVEQASTALTGGASAIVGGSVWAVGQLLITLFALFYFFRDQRPALGTLRSLVPLSARETDGVFTRVSDTIHATVFGTLTVALVQGLLGGVMLWVLGLPAALLWGALMAVLAVVPVLGAFVVWAPAAVFLALSGSWVKALILAGWGALVVSLVDNLLYPILVGQRLRLPTLPVFIATVGGVALFGSAGLVLGPVILTITVALVEIWRRRTADERAAETGGHGSEEPEHRA